MRRFEHSWDSETWLSRGEAWGTHGLGRACSKSWHGWGLGDRDGGWLCALS